MQKQVTQKNYVHATIFAFLLGVFLFSISGNLVHASQTDGTITTGGNTGFAWSTSVGWINFSIANGNVHITDAGMAGNVWSTLRGWVNLAPSNGGITVAADGTLSGYAWGSSLGWINFSGVSINSSGKFVGQATGTLVGTLTFDCDNCSVVTDYLPQNFRTVTPPPSSGGGGGGGGGGFFQSPTNSPGPSTTVTQPTQGGTNVTTEKASTPKVASVSPTSGSKEKPPLFDVQISPGPGAAKNNSVYYIIAVVLIVLAGIAFYLFRRWKKRKDEDEI